MSRGGERLAQQHAGAFRVAVHPEPEAVRVAAAGELDLATAGVLERTLHELRDRGVHHIVLDLSELTFIDSSGIRVVLSEHREAAASGRRFSLVGVKPVIHRALEICGVLGHLDVTRVTSRA